MGCDIHAFVEIKNAGKWQRMDTPVFVADKWTQEHFDMEKIDRPFDFRSYALFGWLANVRNYSQIKPLSNPKGLPENVSDEVLAIHRKWGVDAHFPSYHSLSDLLTVDYERIVENRRQLKRIGKVLLGANVVGEGEAEKMTLRKFLPKRYFDELEVLKTLGDPEDVRVVFWFAN